MSMTGGSYAAQTSVSAQKSRAEIEKTVSRYGATAFACMRKIARLIQDTPGEIDMERDG